MAVKGMRKKNLQKQNGFVVLALDILFVAAGVLVIAFYLLKDKHILSAMLERLF